GGPGARGSGRAGAPVSRWAGYGRPNGTRAERRPWRAPRFLLLSAARGLARALWATSRRCGRRFWRYVRPGLALSLPSALCAPSALRAYCCYQPGRSPTRSVVECARALVAVISEGAWSPAYFYG